MAWPENVTKADLTIQYYRGSGPGGQNRNKRDTACRIKHNLTGLVATAEEFKTQGKNREAAFRRLALKLIPLMKEELSTKIDKEKNTSVIRTYHELRQTVKDKRAQKIFIYKDILDGNLDELIKEIVLPVA